MDLWNTAIRMYCEVQHRYTIQRRQNIILRTLTNARWFQPNEDIHADMELENFEKLTTNRILLLDWGSTWDAIITTTTQYVSPFV